MRWLERFQPGPDGPGLFCKYPMRILLLLLLTTGLAQACDSWVVGFRGLRGDFDQAAFEYWSGNRAQCHRVFDWDQRRQALTFIDSLQVPYELYGFSKGAETVLWLVPRARQRPRSVITLGGWHTVNFDFSPWQVPFDNWFDRSGAGNPGPGRHVPDVPHGRLQAWVNRHYYPLPNQ